MGAKPKLNISSNIRREHSPLFNLAFTHTINTSQQSEYHRPLYSVQCTRTEQTMTLHHSTCFLPHHLLSLPFSRLPPYVCITLELIFNSNDFHLVAAWKHLKSVNEIIYENTNKNAKTIFLPCIKLAPQQKTIWFIVCVRCQRCHVQMKISPLALSLARSLPLFNNLYAFAAIW